MDTLPDNVVMIFVSVIRDAVVVSYNTTLIFFFFLAATTVVGGFSDKKHGLIRNNENLC
jgi:hypothetical protein